MVEPTPPGEPDRRLDRGRFLAAGAAGAGGLVIGAGIGWGVATAVDDDDAAGDAAGDGAFELPDGKRVEDFVVHSEDPVNVETKRGNFDASYLTASGFMFIRANLPLLDLALLETPDEWTLTVEGVNDPRELSVSELKRIGVVTRPTVIQCSGNGRGYFEHEPSGSPWTVGAAANVFWTGVPVSAVAEALGGVRAGMRFLTGTGGEELPSDVSEREAVVERSVPVEKGLQDCLLAWEMNGEPVPLAHGGPLRLIVPGYWGINSVKYLRRLAFTPQESDADIMVSSYRVRPIGVESDPSQPTMWAMNVKSFITSPTGENGSMDAGPSRLFGVAWAGENEIEQVEVSTDGGETWEAATLHGPSLGAAAWRQFTYAFEAEPGELVLASRATDSEGNTQPELRMENEAGYAHNGWRDPAVTLEVA